MRIFDDDPQHVIFSALFLLQPVDILKHLLILILVVKKGNFPFSTHFIRAQGSELTERKTNLLSRRLFRFQFFVIAELEIDDALADITRILNSDITSFFTEPMEVVI